MYEFKSENFFSNGVDLFVHKHTKDTSYQVGPHTHDFAELAYIYSGKGYNVVDGHSYLLEKGSLFFVNYHHSHEIKVTNPIVQIDILLSPRFISRELVGCDNFFDILTLSQYNELGDYTDINPENITLSGQELIFTETLFDRIDDEFRAKQLGYESVIRGCLQILISIIVRRLCGTSPPPPKIPNEILDYIDRFYNEKLTAETLSEKCFYNPAYFGRVFHECYGISFKDYIKRRRINEAVRLIKDTDLTIEEIISKVGYTNRSEFYRVFTSQCGMTPTDLRANSSQPVQLDKDE